MDFLTNQVTKDLLTEALKNNISYECYEKCDGSFVSLSYWQRGKEWICATRGSFDSPQAIDAMKILKEKYDLDKFNKNYTYIFEYISEWNRKSEGAKLVVSYIDENGLSLRDNILLTIFDKKNKRELQRQECEQEVQKLNLKICKKYNYTIQQMIDLQKTLPATEEGFVVKFENGLRLKIKGENYLRMNKILNSMNIKTVWETMVDGKIPEQFLMTVPEEIREEIENYKIQLEEEFMRVKRLAENEQSIILPVISNDTKDSDKYKIIGLFMRDNANKFNYPSLVFPMMRKNLEGVNKIIKDLIKPKLGD